MSTPPGERPFKDAPDVSKAFEQAKGDAPEKKTGNAQERSAAEAPQPRLRPTGPMRGMAGSVDRKVQAQVDARKVAARSEDRAKKEEKRPRRVTGLFREAGKDKEYDRGRS